MSITRKALATLVRRCKQWDKARGLECDLTTDYIEGWLAATNGRCLYTNRLMTEPNGCRSLTAVSVDRLDSGKGHIKGNIVLCQLALNHMRNDTNYEVFKQYLTELGIGTQQQACHAKPTSS